MIQPKEKLCKGINKARMVKGCGKPTKYKTYGLCNDCLSDFLFNTDDGKLIFEKRIIPKAKSNLSKEQKRFDNEKRKNLMTLTDWQKLLEKEVNNIARLIDKDSGCISCGGHTTPSGGHYHSVKSNGSIRFNLDNIHLQDYNCNGNKGANIPKYDLGLIKRYGKQYWEYVKFDIVNKFPLLKMARFEYEEKIKIARSIVKHLKLENKTYSPTERIELRKKYNKMLGIYV